MKTSLKQLNEIKNKLEKPYFENENCMIFCIDCLQAMHYFPKDLVHLTVTSPPYNIGKEYEQVKPLNDYLSWSGQWIKEVHRVTRPNGAFWLNIGYISVDNKGKAVPLAYFLWDKTPFYLIQEIIWNYGAGVAGKTFFSPRNEKLLWYVKDKNNYTFNLDEIRDPNVKYPNQKKNGKLKCNPLGKNPTDVWQIAKVTSGRNRSSKERTSHPAQFPEQLIKRIIKGASNNNDIIMDPFLGSGTTAVVALEQGRKFVGFEVEEKYCQLAVERIQNFLESKKQVDLFSSI